MELAGNKAVVSASSEDFSSALTFSLGQLKLPGLSLKEEQRAAIKAVYEGKDVFVSLPTGYVCYQTLPFVLRSTFALRRG